MRASLFFCLLAVALSACQKVASEPAATPAASAPLKPPPPDYHPSMGDMMTMAVQPRHTKLALAAKEKNWAYAAYEADELKNAFDRIAHTIPDYRNNDMAKMFEANIKPAIAETKKAIEASNAKAFEAAFAKLTAQCNACHEALDHS